MKGGVEMHGVESGGGESGLGKLCACCHSM